MKGNTKSNQKNWGWLVWCSVRIKFHERT